MTADSARRRRQAHRARSFRKFSNGLIPRKAPTRTWMMLTFALFVGMAVIAVALYIGLVLRNDVRASTRAVLLAQAERIADRADELQGGAEYARLAEATGRITGMHVRFITPEAVYRGGPTGETVDFPSLPVSAEEPRAFQVYRPGSGPPYYVVALFHPASGGAIEVAQERPPFLLLVRRMEVALVLSMFIVLALALVGSWIAAQQVTRPLSAIRDSARSISEGKLNERIRVESRATEFQELASRLNLMSNSFREKIGELQRLAQLQNEFIGNVSHEVRNPIFAVGGYLEALSTSSLKDEQRKRYAEKGLANLQRLNNLFNDLIEIARLEYREDLIQTAVFDIAELVDEVADMLRPKAAEKGLSIEADNPPMLVRADRNRIRQVLVNLIDNAIAYTDEGTVRCRMRVRLDKVRIEVIDTGRGIPEEHLERVFERFYRVDPDRSRKSGGTGLGLSIVKQILHAHGEAIHVESTVARGTRFWFELALAGETTPVGEPA